MGQVVAVLDALAKAGVAFVVWIGSVNTRASNLQDTVNTRASNLQGSMNARFDDTNSRIDELNDRMTGVENGLRELRELLIEALNRAPITAHSVNRAQARRARSPPCSPANSMYPPSPPPSIPSPFDTPLPPV